MALKIGWRLASALAAGGFTLLVAASVFVFEENLSKFLIAPRTPYQIYSPPPSPDYDLDASWAFAPPEPGAETAGADIFYVHSTTYYSSGGWNAPVGETDASERLQLIAAPNEAGPFAPLGALIAPKYRQATLFSFFTHKIDGREARRTAYADVRSAFEAYLADADPERPLFLVGYGQGALHVLGLLDQFFDDTELRKRLVAAYVIDHAAPADFFGDPFIAAPICRQPDEVRCVVAYTAMTEDFDDEIRRARLRGMMWTASGDLTAIRGRDLVCVNPLDWRLDTEAGPRQHVGAASATGLSVLDDAIPISGAVGARCEDGVLIVDKPEASYLRRRAGFGREWRAQNFNLFFYDLRANALERLSRWREVTEAESRIAPPIGDAEEVGRSPIKPID